ncbi:MAG: hypothetical protein ACRDNJ_13925, partial [Solirubrobacteraceae bacterium]
MRCRTTRSTDGWRRRRVADAVAVAAAERTVGQLLASAQVRLREAGCDTPRLDAELLLGEALDPAHPVSRARLVLD